MPVTFEVAEDEDKAFIMHVMEQYHLGLSNLAVTVDVLMASPARDVNGDPTAPALKHHGHKAYAVIRPTKSDERALGQADIHLKISKEDWDEFSVEQRTALVDHEFLHLTPKTDAEGAVKRDDYNRPLFTKVPHDLEVGWMFSAARRHGRNSIEVKQLQDLMDSDAYRDCFAPSVSVPVITRRRIGGPNPATGDI